MLLLAWSCQVRLANVKSKGKFHKINPGAFSSLLLLLTKPRNSKTCNKHNFLLSSSFHIKCKQLKIVQSRVSKCGSHWPSKVTPSRAVLPLVLCFFLHLFKTIFQVTNLKCDIYPQTWPIY